MYSRLNHILKVVWGIVSLHIPIKKNVVCFDSFGGQYNDNPKYVSEELHRQCPNITIVWNHSGKGKEEQWQRFADHMDEKYSRNGYIKLWIPNSPNEKALKELRNIIEDKTELRKYFEEIYEELRKKKS